MEQGEYSKLLKETKERLQRLILELETIIIEPEVDPYGFGSKENGYFIDYCGNVMRYHNHFDGAKKYGNLFAVKEIAEDEAKRTQARRMLQHIAEKEFGKISYCPINVYVLTKNCESGYPEHKAYKYRKVREEDKVSCSIYLPTQKSCERAIDYLKEKDLIQWLFK